MQHRAALNLAEDGPAEDVVVAWNEWPEGATADKVHGGLLGNPTPRTRVIRALVHYVQPMRSDVQRFNEFAAGDCLLDVGGDVDLAGLADVRFHLGGEVWMQKKIGDQLVPSVDVRAGGEILHRTFLLSRAT